MRIERDLARLDGTFDVAIIGGGITGVHVAREAAGRGLRVLLMEKGDFGGGTSSATTKYIHGGIRYLETYEFAVVRESLRERRIVGLSAPHLVSQMRFLMPAWRWSKPPAPLIGAGVLTYSALGFDKNRGAPDSLKVPRPAWLSKRSLLAAVPWLEGSELQGGFAYYDTLNIHPERLLLAYLQDAVAAGAVALNHMRAVEIVMEPGPASGSDTATGVRVVDELTGAEHLVRSRTIVNAGGPWMDLVLRGVPRDLGVRVNRSKGVHILTRALGGDDAVFARAPSGKHVIVSPWLGRSWIGPTDTPISTGPDEAQVAADDVDLIIDTVNATIGDPTVRVSRVDIEQVAVGIRPLIAEEGKDSYSTSRRHELFDHAPGGVRHLWSIGGGKWTTGRALGEETVEALLASEALADVRARSFDSRKATAFGTFGWAEDAEAYLDAAARARANLGLDRDVRLHLARLYGTEHDRVLDIVERDPRLGARISSRPGRLDIAAQAVFAVTDEAACTLADVIHRRLVLGTLGPPTDDELATVADLVAPLLGWTADHRASQIEIERAKRRALAVLQTVDAPAA
jgi:glycerol-3-phosphate dehydrogenase